MVLASPKVQEKEMHCKLLELKNEIISHDRNVP